MPIYKKNKGRSLLKPTSENRATRFSEYFLGIPDFHLIYPYLLFCTRSLQSVVTTTRMFVSLSDDDLVNIFNAPFLLVDGFGVLVRVL